MKPLDDPAGRNTDDLLAADLRGRGGLYASWEELERALGMTRANIREVLDRLADLGYELDDHPAHGVRLLAAPDLLLAQEIQPGLSGPLLRGPARCFRTVGSTNSVLLELGAQGAPEGTLVVAEEQEAGRGRYRRRWHSPPGLGLWFSILLRPAKAPEASSPLTIVTSLAVAAAVRRVSGIAARLKWPNDVMVDGRKLAGVLAELVGEPGRVKFIAMGVGVNVNNGGDDFPAELRGRATSLRLVSGRREPRVKLLLAILDELERRYTLFLRHGLGPMIDEWNGLALWLGELVELVTGGGRRQGIAVGLAESGGLLWRTAAGLQEVVLAGDLSLAGTRS